MKAKVLLMDEDKENLNAQDDQEDEYNPDVVSVIDEDGVEHFLKSLTELKTARLISARSKLKRNSTR